MDAPIPITRPSADSELLIQTQSYLTRREHSQPPSQDLEAAWRVFYDLYGGKIRAYACTCGVAEEDIADCVQEIWCELLVRLPTFQLDPCRGQFDTWLFTIVRSKTADLHRSRKRRLLQGNSENLQTVTDYRPRPSQPWEEEEMVTVVLDQLRNRLSECNFQVLQLRLVEQLSVAEVAAKLGLSHEQVWYRYHRARRELKAIGSALAREQPSPRVIGDPPHEKKRRTRNSRKGKRPPPYHIV